MRLLMLLCVALSMLPLQAAAAGSARLVTASGETVTLEWLDHGHIRVQGGPIIAGHVLIRDGRAWSVIQQAGQSLVMELSTLATMMPSRLRRDMLRHGLIELDDVRPVGRHETLAGIRGELHEVHFRTADGEQRQIEMVIARDALAREFMEVFEVFGRILSRDIGRDIPVGELELSDRLQKNRQGLLRVGGDLRVEHLERTRPEPSRFELPARSFRLPGRLDADEQVRAPRHKNVIEPS